MATETGLPLLVLVEVRAAFVVVFNDEGEGETRTVLEDGFVIVLVIVQEAAPGAAPDPAGHATQLDSDVK